MQPTKFTQNYDYSEELTSTDVPGSHGAHLDTDIAEIKAVLDAVIDNLAIIQRDDTLLRNAVVHPDSLTTATKALIASDWTPRGLWVTLTAYVVGDVIENSNASYVCAVAHTAGTFATDHTAGKWVVLDSSILTVEKWGIAAGTANAMTVTVTDLESYPSGQLIGVRAVGANSVVAPTINVNGLGAITIVKFGNAALVANDYVTGQELFLRYNTTNTKFELLNPRVAMIADGAVDTTQLADGAVEAAKIETGAVTSTKIAYETVNGCHW